MRGARLLLLGVFVASLMVFVSGAIAKNEGPGEPPQGSKFDLFGTAQDDVDPENAWNEVISCDTTAGVRCGVQRTTKKLQVRQIDNEMELKYHFVGRTCNAGSPRLVVVIDRDGKGKDRDLVLDGHTGVPPSFTGCPPNTWRYEDITDNLPRIDVRALTAGSQPPGTAPNVYLPWDTAENAVHAAFPNHQIIQLRLVDDSGAFSAPAQGCAYYDVVSLGPRTLTDWHDTRGHKPDNGFTNNC